MVNGCVVKFSMPWYRDKSKVVIHGVFSGGEFGIGTQWVVTHYRTYRDLGKWRVERVGSASRVDGSPRETTMLLAPVAPTLPFSKSPILENDVLVINDGSDSGDGTYTTLEFNKTNMKLRIDSSVEVGPNRYHAVALVDHSPISSTARVVKPKRLVMFHKPGAKLPQSVVPVWWRNKVYEADVVVPDSYLESRLHLLSERWKQLSQDMRWAVVDALDQVESVLNLQESQALSDTA